MQGSDTAVLFQKPYSIKTQYTRPEHHIEEGDFIVIVLTVAQE